MQDLVVLAADVAIEQAMMGVLENPAKVGMREITFRVDVHSNRDPGCYLTGAELLKTSIRVFSHALVVFDRAWEGAPSKDASVLAGKVEQDLQRDWGDRARCLVIDPEIETWIWSPSPNVANAVGWGKRSPDLRTWLDGRGLWATSDAKPGDPKKAFVEVMYEVGLPPSSSVFRRLAGQVSFRTCQDLSFRRLLDTLAEWFPA